MLKYPSDDLMSFFGELKCVQVWGNFPLVSTSIKKIPLNFHLDSRFTYYPGDSPQNPRDFARWVVLY